MTSLAHPASRRFLVCRIPLMILMLPRICSTHTCTELHTLQHAHQCTDTKGCMANLTFTHTCNREVLKSTVLTSPIACHFACHEAEREQKGGGGI